ncbi:hypothetical protein CPB84DRAFT_1757999 [Gymnopilus junonius]|uniref:Uncharacterized protein n=1 Tax=Gymnopilus junonius TaxID=109634 RepID=A0A9P5TVR9_GYMJU|nr:hypothetical protein CPB84DRAFT_1757999 [Gymnopilus junonius]
MDPATSKFEQALPLVLLPISAPLAALHSARASHPYLPYVCSRCGSELTSRTRVKRSKSNTHAVQTVCDVCGGTTSIIIDPLAAKEFPSWRKLRSQALRPRPRTQPQVIGTDSNVEGPSTPSLVSKVSKTPATLQHLNTKSKKKAGLQELLQRNRDKEKKRTRTEEAKPAGLSAFLSTL